MGSPILVARCRILNGGGTWDSLNLADPSTQPRIVASIKRTLSNEPNLLEMGVYNLSDDTVNLVNDVVTVRIDWTPAERAELLAAGASAEPIEQTSDAQGLGVVELSWGYADSETIDQDGELEAALGIGFIGQIIDGPRQTREGLDTVFVMTASDAGATLGAAEVIQEAGGGEVSFESKSYAAGVRVAVVIADMVNAIGLDVDVDALDGQLAAAFAVKGYPSAELELGAGYNASGPARAQIEAFFQNLDLLWSVQNGEFLVLDPTSTIPGFVPLELGPDQLIGTPERIAPNKVNCATAANSEALPGRQVNISTASIVAGLRIFESDTRIDSYSGGQTELKTTALQVIEGVI